MYRATECLACGSSDLLIRPGFLSRIIVWRTTGTDFGEDIQNNVMICSKCTFEFSEFRLSNDEEIKYYTDYRSAMYDQQRKICTPFYENLKTIFEQPWYIETRKKAVSDLVSKFVDPLKINSLLDYGGDTGCLIPDVFKTAKKYVYDLSNRSLINDVYLYNLEDKFKFDLVICSHVLEHKSNPSDLITQLKELMNESGLLYLEVPYKEVYPIPPNTFDEHLNEWNEKSLKKFLQRHNINILKMGLYDIANGSVALKVLCKLNGGVS